MDVLQSSESVDSLVDMFLVIPQWGPLFQVDHDVLAQEQGQDLLRSRDVQGVRGKIFFPLEDLIVTFHHRKKKSPNLAAYS